MNLCNNIYIQEEPTLIESIPFIIIIIMGNRCNCCLFTQQDSSDTDSITKRSDIAVDGQPKLFAAYKMAEKKISKATSVQLQRQQSRYFKKNKVFQSPSANNQTPLLLLDKKRIVKKKKGQEHTSYYNRIRQKIRPQIDDSKRNDQDFSSDNSKGEYYKQIQQALEQSSQNQENNNDISIRFEQNQQNLSFQFPSAPLAIQNEYRTQKNNEAKRLKKSPEDIQKLYSLAESTNQSSQLLDCYTDLAYYKFLEKDLQGSQKFLTKALNSPALNEQNSQKKSYKNPKKFKLYVLAGSIYVLRNNTTQGLDYLLKAMKIQSTGKENQSINLIECYYWLGEAYFKLSKQSQSKEYFNKAYRLYIKHKVKEPKLMASVCLNLGKAYNNLEEYAEADRFYCRGLKEAEHSGDVGFYVQILLKTAENSFDMDEYHSSLIRFKTIFELIEKFQWKSEIVETQAKKSLGNLEVKLQKMNLSQNELRTLVAMCQQICPLLQEFKPLKAKMDKLSNK